MSQKPPKGPPPPLLRISEPNTKAVYALRVALVTRENEQGIPTYLRVLDDDEEIVLEGGEKFVTIYVHEDALKPRKVPVPEKV